jgi:hypothetical protein
MGQARRSTALAVTTDGSDVKCWPGSIRSGKSPSFARKHPNPSALDPEGLVVDLDRGALPVDGGPIHGNGYTGGYAGGQEPARPVGQPHGRGVVFRAGRSPSPHSASVRECCATGPSGGQSRLSARSAAARDWPRRKPLCVCRRDPERRPRRAQLVVQLAQDAGARQEPTACAGGA